MSDSTGMLGIDQVSGWIETHVVGIKQHLEKVHLITKQRDVRRRTDAEFNTREEMASMIVDNHFQRDEVLRSLVSKSMQYGEGRMMPRAIAMKVVREALSNLSRKHSQQLVGSRTRAEVMA